MASRDDDERSNPPPAPVVARPAASPPTIDEIFAAAKTGPTFGPTPTGGPSVATVACSQCGSPRSGTQRYGTCSFCGHPWFAPAHQLPQEES